ncbi:hypothetical protein ACTVZO_00630 [Streptomyces sp. IBSNAI002]|uniref:hypothetical protein n=1 Tax=Streptomyces sp. IBSNAI002 TaxID=3457500 RepID=UPI003FD1EE41
MRRRQPETTALPLAPIAPHPAISAFGWLGAVQAGDVEATRGFADAEPRMAELLVAVVERIVVSVTALPGAEAGEPTTEIFALEALGRVLVATLRSWAQVGPPWRRASPAPSSALSCRLQKLFAVRAGQRP